MMTWVQCETFKLSNLQIKAVKKKKKVKCHGV